jgi:hypothetical protein
VVKQPAEDLLEDRVHGMSPKIDRFPKNTAEVAEKLTLGG